MLSGKATIAHVMVVIIKKNYNIEPDSHVKNKIKFELDLSNYATICDGKDSRCWYIIFCKKFDLDILKSDIDMLGMNKFKTGSTDLIRLSNVVNNEVVKMTLYNYLVTKVTVC